MRLRAVWKLMGPFLVSTVALASVPLPAERMRVRLQGLVNEAELLIANEKLERAERIKQEKDAVVLRLYDRIPLATVSQEDESELSAQLRAHAAQYGITLQAAQPLASRRKFKRPLPPPKRVYTDDSSFALSEEQLVDRVPLELKVSSEVARAKLDRWIAAWNDELVRYLDTPVIEKVGDGWRVLATAYRFRDIQFPELIARDPMEYLPAEAKASPERFAQKYPNLWTMVLKARELQPRARPIYQVKRDFLLSKARLSFYLKRTR